MLHRPAIRESTWNAMESIRYRRASLVEALVFPLVLVTMLSGCTLFGMGAAAGATVGGCSLLDENEDEQITQAEFRTGLFDSWDTDDDGLLTEDEFEAGTGRGEVFDELSGDFEAWDDDGDDTLSESEFEAGIAASDDELAWLDRQCDDLGL